MGLTMVLQFKDVRDGQFSVALLALLAVLKTFSDRRRLSKIFDAIGVAVQPIESEFKISMSKYSKYKTRNERGEEIIDPKKMTDDDRLLFESDFDGFLERNVLEIGREKFSVDESDLNKLAVGPYGFILLEKFFEIELIPSLV